MCVKSFKNKLFASNFMLSLYIELYMFVVANYLDFMYLYLCYYIIHSSILKIWNWFDVDVWNNNSKTILFGKWVGSSLIRCWIVNGKFRVRSNVKMKIKLALNWILIIMNLWIENFVYLFVFLNWKNWFET